MLLRPGHPGWSRSFLVDLRDEGPRPQLAVAQPVDLVTGRPAPIGVGETVRLWSVHDIDPWQVQGHVSNVGVVESRGAGPVHAARLVLPWRLQAAERRLVPRPTPSLRVGLRTPDQDRTRTLVDTWTSPTTEPIRRGDAWIVELSRRTLTWSVPADSGPVLLPGTHVEVSLQVREPALQTLVPGRVEVVFELGEQLLYGVGLGAPMAGTSADEHRELLRRAGI